MPWITVETSVELPMERRTKIAEAITAAMSALMGKRREVTAVRFAVAAAGSWFVDAICVDALHATVDIKITRGTNTVAQKAALLAKVHEALQPLAEPSYLIIDEIDADAWGYAGLSQATRLFGSAL
ncbi:MAG: hypothetical protein H6981_12210 [Gammaproteobacteria bacterium]|nr:hypothetical protein [Gammaproteobacteria bacterium]MCP5137553.1 hypothetical protein [Gammaproteobacteria bacterium]